METRSNESIVRALEDASVRYLIVGDPAIREKWRTDKGMIVLKLWSDEHRRTPIDVFVYEPFNFDQEYAAVRVEILPGLRAPIVSLPGLLQMKREAGRPRGLEDINELTRGRETRQ